MRHNHDGFWNYKKLVESILDDVSDIQDYPYNLPTVMVMISDLYRSLGEDFPEGRSYRDAENVTIYWGSDLRRQVVLEDRWKGGLKLSIGSDEVFICNYHRPSEALISTLVFFMQGD